MYIRTTSQFFIIGIEYAFFWWGLFALYCIGYQLNRIRVYRIRRKRLNTKAEILVPPLPGAKLFHRLDYCVPIPFVTEMFPLKHIIGLTLFSIINVLFIVLGPFAFADGGFKTNPAPSVGLMDRRAAFVGMINWGFIFFLAQRNSIVAKMSGLTFEELIPFHRILARIGLAEFFPHFIWRMIVAWNRTGVAKDIFFRNTEQTTGTISMFAFLLMFVTSIEYVRRNYFEIFYYSHVIFLLVALIFACWHETTCFAVFIPAIILWVADRAIRTYNSWFVKSTFIRVEEVAPQTATQEGILRILFENRLLNIFKPGQYVFTSMVINGKKIWEYANWHPFTVSEVFRINQNTPSVDIEELVVGEEEKKGKEEKASTNESNRKQPDSLSDTSSDTGSLRRRANVLCHQDQNTTIASVHIKALGTKTRDVLQKAAEQSLVKVYMDGPYGPQLQFQDYPVLALFATGIGVTPALSIVKDVVDKRAKGILTVSTEQVYLSWAIRHTDEIHPFMDIFHYWVEKSQQAIQPINLNVTIYVTRVQEGPDIVSALPGFKIIYGQRPHVETEMDRIKTLSGLHNRVWAHACGSSVFTREVINQAVKHHFDCHNETFEF